MANTITNVLPKLLAQGMISLRERAIMPRLVNRSYDELASQRGNVINVPIPSAISARDVAPSVTYANNQDSAPGVALVTLSLWKEASFQLSDNDMVSVMNGFIPMQAQEAIKAVSNAIDQYILALHTGVFSLVGTPGTTPFNGSLTVAKQARVLLNKQLAPEDDRRAVLDPSAEGNLLLNQEILQAQERGDTGGIIRGVIGTKLGMDWYMDQNVQSYTPGTGWASGNIASTVAGAVGDVTLNIINSTASGAIKVGDIFQLASDTSAYPQQYVVTAAATISATVPAVIKFYPALKAAVATGATLVVVSVPYVANVAFHRDAFAWASRPLQDLEGFGHSIMSAVDPISGIALRLEVSRQYKQTTFSYDVLGGANLIRPELAVKIAG